MDFQNVEVGPNTCLYKDILIVVGDLKSTLKGINYHKGVDIKLGIINEVDDGNHDSQDNWLNSTYEKSDKYMLHLSVLFFCPLHHK
jgi:hypothetical protein